MNERMGKTVDFAQYNLAFKTVDFSQYNLAFNKLRLM